MRRVSDEHKVHGDKLDEVIGHVKKE